MMVCDRDEASRSLSPKTIHIFTFHKLNFYQNLDRNPKDTQARATVLALIKPNQYSMSKFRKRAKQFSTKTH